MPASRPTPDAAIDARLLIWLARYPLQRAEDLVLGLARWGARPTIYRHLTTLSAAGLVTSVSASWGGGAPLYLLSSAGVRWCRTTLGEDALADPPEALRRLLPRLPVLLPLQAFLNGALCHLAHGLADQGHPPALVRWDWQRDYAHPFTFREQEVTLRADAAWTFGVQGQQAAGQETPSWFVCLFFCHPLTIARIMTARLERLLCWRESTERWAHYQAMPPVLILAHSQRQAVWWHVCAEKAAARLRVDPPGGAIACLEEHAGQPSPWQWTWRRLVSQEQVHLREILTPLPLDALPQDLRPVMPDPLTTPVLLERPVPWEGETRVGRSPRLAPVSLRAPQRAREWGKPAHLAWVSLHLSARQWELLLLLFAHPLLSNEELAALLGVRASSMRVLLHAVARWDVLTAQPRKGGTRWRLSALGLRLLAAAQQVDVRNLTMPIVAEDDSPLIQRGLPWLQQHVEHTAGVYGFFAALARAPQDEGRLVWWETGATCERRYRRQDRWQNFRPDALAEYRCGSRTIRFWLEWDRGTMNERDLRRKFASYASYLSSREWARERQPLPLLVCVTPTPEQEQRLTRAAHGLIQAQRELVMYTTTSSLLDAQGPVSAIWRRVLLLTQHAEVGQRTVLFSNAFP
ncbi:MAG TPA: replication-relaxation family protein [Ktedonobacteraceae bacterium]|nr:replication-relaxation family protein [Ktedonobacteraceae bacterium]